MAITVHISETIRCIAKDLPKTVIVESSDASTIRKLAAEIGVPSILIVFAVVDGYRKGLEDNFSDDSRVIHLMGAIAGG